MIEKAKARKTEKVAAAKSGGRRKVRGVISRRSRCLVFRGCWNSNNGANGGAFFVNSNNSLTNSNTNIGARLAEQKETEMISPP